jgi:DNA topoisomerase-2
LAFDPSKANERKEWLKASKADECVDCTKASLTYADFVHKELVQYSLSDNVRSIPSAVDGLKPSQRKVLFACLTRGLTKEMKVAQLAGYVAEKSCYHHGEKSLAAVIIGMAQVKRHVDHCSIVLLHEGCTKWWFVLSLQNFVGSNNVNILYPSGQFGTRLMGGKDAASERYVFTHLANVTRFIFREEDDDLLVR